MTHYQKLPKPVSDSQSDTTRFSFEFPTTSFGVQQNDVVFCRKVITRRAKPSPPPHQTKRQSNRFVSRLWAPSDRESQYRRSGNRSESRSSKKSYTGMFGTIKFPLQMELSDIKMRQERRKSMPKLPMKDGVSGGCWEMVQSLRKKETLMSVLKASFGCFRIV